MSLIIGIICLMASLFYGATAVRQKSMFAVRMRIVTSVLYFMAASIWLFRN